MPFKKKKIEEKMKPFMTTLKPEAYIRLKNEAERRNSAMSVVLSELILDNFEEDPWWVARLKGVK
jgi:hypothetical protein